MKARSLARAADEKTGLHLLFSSQMRTHSIQSRAFIQVVCQRTRRERKGAFL